jgi:voltage-gated potassium channel
VLLAAIVIAFLVRPLIGDGSLARTVFSLVFLLVMVLAVYIIWIDERIGDETAPVAQRWRHSIVGCALAVPAIAGRLIAFFAPDRRLYLAFSITGLLFFAFITWSELRDVLRQKTITGETIRMAILVYLLLGLTWGLLYAVIFQVRAESFNLGPSFSAISSAHFDQADLFPTFLYFSLTTMATIGFGDITPVSLLARHAAVAEGIIGQLFLAILVARLVGLQMSQQRDHDP